MAISELVDGFSEHTVRMIARKGRTLFKPGGSPGLFLVHSGKFIIAEQDAVGHTLLRVAAQPGSLCDCVLW